MSASESERPPDGSTLDQRDAEQGDSHSCGGLRQDVVAAFALSLMIVVGGLFLIVAFVWTSGAFAEVNAGDGEVSINGGEAYVGDGCVRAGDVVVGDCEDGTEGGGDLTDVPEMMPETTSQEGEGTTETTQESTAFEVTFSEETTTEATEGAIPEDAPEQNEAACPTGPTGTTHEASVTRAVDGDTFEISDEIEGTDQVRLIGVDSPETNAVEDDSGGADEGDGKPEAGAKEAMRFSAETLEGQDIVLEPGEDSKDDYGRLLAYAWVYPPDTADTSDAEATDTETAAAEATEAAEATVLEAGKDLEARGLFSDLKRLVGMEVMEDGADPPNDQSDRAGGAELFNATLLEEEHADVLTVKPNDTYAECFEAITAREDEQGGQGGAVEEQYAPSEEQYEEEQTVPETPDQKAIEETTSKPLETTMQPAKPVDPVTPVEPIGETTSSLTTKSVVEETTAAPENTTTLMETKPLPQVPDEQYAEQTSAETTKPEEATQAEEAAPTPELSLPEETTSAPEASGDGPTVTEPVPEPPTELPQMTYIPSGTADYSSSLPTVQTPEGSVTVLPDTGGPPLDGLVAMVLGTVCVMVGIQELLFAALLRPGLRLRRRREVPGYR